MTSHSSKRILLCVSGSISAYKAADLTSLLKKRGYEVQCLLSAGGENFIPRLVLETLSGHPVPQGLWGADISGTEHIRLARETDLILFAPASAHLIARLSLGLADDLITTVALASRAPWIMAPAMNTVMWEASTTQEHITHLEARGVLVIPPAEGILACGEEGAGKLAELDKIVQEVERHFAGGTSLVGQHLLITSGPTISRIDAVRYITNPSTGRMGKALAEEALARGARVTVIQGMDKGICLPVDRQQTGRLTVVPVETAEEMREQALRHLAAATGVIATAAVLDYRVKDPSASKVKRNQESVTLELEPSADVLQALRQAAGSDQWFLGFAAETDAVLENGKLKLDRKRLDWLFANAVARTGETTPTGFGSTQNAGVLLSRTGEALSISLASKHQVAGQILNEISNQLSRARPNSHPAPGVSAP